MGNDYQDAALTYKSSTSQHFDSWPVGQLIKPTDTWQVQSTNANTDDQSSSNDSITRPSSPPQPLSRGISHLPGPPPIYGPVAQPPHARALNSTMNFNVDSLPNTNHDRHPQVEPNLSIRYGQGQETHIALPDTKQFNLQAAPLPDTLFDEYYNELGYLPFDHDLDPDFDIGFNFNDLGSIVPFESISAPSQNATRPTLMPFMETIRPTSAATLVPHRLPIPILIPEPALNLPITDPPSPCKPPRSAPNLRWCPARIHKLTHSLPPTNLPTDQARQDFANGSNIKEMPITALVPGHTSVRANVHHGDGGGGEVVVEIGSRVSVDGAAPYHILVKGADGGVEWDLLGRWRDHGSSSN